MPATLRTFAPIWIEWSLLAFKTGTARPAETLSPERLRSIVPDTPTCVIAVRGTDNTNAGREAQLSQIWNNDTYCFGITCVGPSVRLDTQTSPCCA